MQEQPKTQRYETYKEYLDKSGTKDFFATNPIYIQWVNAILDASKHLNINAPVRNMLSHEKLSDLLSQYQASEHHSAQVASVLHELLEVDEVYLKHVLFTPFLHEPVIVTREGNLTSIRRAD